MNFVFKITLDGTEFRRLIENQEKMINSLEIIQKRLECVEMIVNSLCQIAGEDLRLKVNNIYIVVKHPNYKSINGTVGKWNIEIEERVNSVWLGINYVNKLWEMWQMLFRTNKKTRVKKVKFKKP